MVIKAINNLTNALNVDRTGEKNNDFEALKQLEEMVTNRLTNTTKDNKTVADKLLPSIPEQPPRVHAKPIEAPAFNTRSSAARTDLKMAMHLLRTESRLLHKCK